MLISIGIMVVNFSVGILALLAVVIYNNVTYFGMKKEIEPYITCLLYTSAARRETLILTGVSC